MLTMAPEVEAYKKRYYAIVEKFIAAGFQVNRELNSFTVAIEFSGKKSPSLSTEGSLGALRKILRSTPEIEMVHLNETFQWLYKAPR